MGPSVGCNAILPVMCSGCGMHRAEVLQAPNGVCGSNAPLRHVSGHEEPSSLLCWWAAVRTWVCSWFRMGEFEVARGNMGSFQSRESHQSKRSDGCGDVFC